MIKLFKIFFIFSIAFICNDAYARFGGRVGGFRSFSRPSISRSYSRPTIRTTTKPAVKTKTTESSNKKSAQPKKQVVEQHKKETETQTNTTSTGTTVQSSSGSMMPWFFAGYMINRDSSNGNIRCDCSPLKDKPEMYQKCLQQCPKDRK